MTLVEAVRKGNARAGNWRTVKVVDYDFSGLPAFDLYHYGTCMMRWIRTEDGHNVPLWFNLGWGSKSDQEGMNKAFRELGMPYYYSRKGGAACLIRTDKAGADVR